MSKSDDESHLTFGKPPEPPESSSEDDDEDMCRAISELKTRFEEYDFYTDDTDEEDEFNFYDDEGLEEKNMEDAFFDLCFSSGSFSEETKANLSDEKKLKATIISENFSPLSISSQSLKKSAFKPHKKNPKDYRRASSDLTMLANIGLKEKEIDTGSPVIGTPHDFLHLASGKAALLELAPKKDISKPKNFVHVGSGKRALLELGKTNNDRRPEYRSVEKSLISGPTKFSHRGHGEGSLLAEAGIPLPASPKDIACFHGFLTRSEADNILVGKKDGTYLLRCKTGLDATDQIVFVSILSVTFKGKATHHTLIKNPKGEYFVNRQLSTGGSTSISEVLLYFKKKRKGWPVPLRFPLLNFGINDNYDFSMIPERETCKSLILSKQTEEQYPTSNNVIFDTIDTNVEASERQEYEGLIENTMKRNTKLLRSTNSAFTSMKPLSLTDKLKNNCASRPTEFVNESNKINAQKALKKARAAIDQKM